MTDVGYASRGVNRGDVYRCRVTVPNRESARSPSIGGEQAPLPSENVPFNVAAATR